MANESVLFVDCSSISGFECHSDISQFGVRFLSALRAIFQKSEVLFVMNAIIFTGFCVLVGGGEEQLMARPSAMAAAPTKVS
jgi:hypothetical protein